MNQVDYKQRSKQAFINELPKLLNLFPALKPKYSWFIKQSMRSNSCYIEIYSGYETYCIRVSDHYSNNYPNGLLTTIISKNGDFILNKIVLKEIESALLDLTNSI